VNEKDGAASSFLNIVEFHASDLMFAVLVLDPYRFAYLIDWHSGIVQLSRVQRDVLTHRSTRAVAVGEAEQVIFVTGGQFTSAVALHLLQDFGYVHRGLIGFSGSPEEHRRRQSRQLQRRRHLHLSFLRLHIAGAHGKPGNSAEQDHSAEDQPDRL
jgi:hypothetical protein